MWGDYGAIMGLAPKLPFGPLVGHLAQKSRMGWMVAAGVGRGAECVWSGWWAYCARLLTQGPSLKGLHEGVPESIAVDPVVVGIECLSSFDVLKDVYPSHHVLLVGTMSIPLDLPDENP